MIPTYKSSKCHICPEVPLMPSGSMAEAMIANLPLRINYDKSNTQTKPRSHQRRASHTGPVSVQALFFPNDVKLFFPSMGPHRPREAAAIIGVSTVFARRRRHRSSLTSRRHQPSALTSSSSIIIVPSVLNLYHHIQSDKAIHSPRKSSDLCEG